MKLAEHPNFMYIYHKVLPSHQFLQTSLTAVEQVKVEQSIAEEGRLLYEQGDLRIEVVELTRLAAIKADEREQKARDFMRAEMRYHRAVEDLKTKQLQIQDHEKKYKGILYYRSFSFDMITLLLQSFQLF